MNMTGFTPVYSISRLDRHIDAHLQSMLGRRIE